MIVARVKGDDYFTPWSAPITFTGQGAVRPLLRHVPRLRGARATSCAARCATVRPRQPRHRLRPRKGRKGGKYRRLGRSSKINSKGRFTLRFKLRRTGVYRLQYRFKGSSLVTAGKVTEMVRIRRRVFFG